MIASSSIMNPGSLLLIIPVAAATIVSYFRVDETLASSSKRQSTRSKPSGTDANGDPILCDPDGRRWS